MTSGRAVRVLDLEGSTATHRARCAAHSLPLSLLDDRELDTAADYLDADQHRGGAGRAEDPFGRPDQHRERDGGEQVAAGPGTPQRRGERGPPVALGQRWDTGADPREQIGWGPSRRLPVITPMLHRAAMQPTVSEAFAAAVKRIVFW
jgi:hypothetical protein